MKNTLHASHAVLDSLYRSYRGIIEARCVRVLKDKAAAEDATQEVFVRVSIHLASMPRTAPEQLGWLLRIATNHCFNLRRNGRRRAEVLDTFVTHPVPLHPEEKIIQRAEAFQLLQDAPEKLRSAAALYFCEGFEQNEIALHLGVCRRTVINRLSEFVGQSRSRARRRDPTVPLPSRTSAIKGLRRQETPIFAGR